jgi:hypothetical protein
LAAVLELPEEIGLLSLRELGPVIARLRARHQLNILGMEALAAAVQLDADVAVSARSPRLEEALTVDADHSTSPPDRVGPVVTETPESQALLEEGPNDHAERISEARTPVNYMAGIEGVTAELVVGNA